MDIEIDVTVLQEAVEWSDGIFHACYRAARQPSGDDFASLALFRHMIQMADAVLVLLSANTSRPTIPLLRSMLESFFSLKYIHRDKYRQRSLCWLCAYIHQEIALKELADAETPTGKKFQDIVTKENPSWQPRPTSQKARDDVEALSRHLLKPDLKSIEHEYQKLKERDKRKNPPRWYSLFDGPKSIYEIAKEVGSLALYRLFYDHWSATVHGTDATNLLFEQGDGTAEFRQRRSLEHPDHYAEGAVLFLLPAAKLMANKFLNESDPERLKAEFASTPK